MPISEECDVLVCLQSTDLSMLISRALTTPSSGPGISPARIGRSLSFRRAAAVQARKRISGMFAVQVGNCQVLLKS